MYNFDKLINGETNAQEDGHISYANEPYKADNSTYTKEESSDTSFSHIIEKLEATEANITINDIYESNRGHQSRNDKKADMNGIDVAIGKADFGDNSIGQITKPKKENKQ
jgi:hypothetical protein